MTQPAEETAEETISRLRAALLNVAEILRVSAYTHAYGPMREQCLFAEQDARYHASLSTRKTD